MFRNVIFAENGSKIKKEMRFEKICSHETC